MNVRIRTGIYRADPGLQTIDGPSRETWKTMTPNQRYLYLEAVKAATIEACVEAVAYEVTE